MRGDFGDRLQRAGLVVRVHHADQYRLGPQRAANVVRVNHAVGTGPDIGNRDARALQFAAGIQNSRMLDGGGDDVLLGRAVGEHGAQNGEVVRLRPAAGKHQLLGLAAE